MAQWFDQSLMMLKLGVFGPFLMAVGSVAQRFFGAKMGASTIT